MQVSYVSIPVISVHSGQIVAYDRVPINSLFELKNVLYFNEIQNKYLI